MKVTTRLVVLVMIGVASLAHADIVTYQKNKLKDPTIQFDLWCAVPRWITGAVAGMSTEMILEALS